MVVVVEGTQGGPFGISLSTCSHAHYSGPGWQPGEVTQSPLQKWPMGHWVPT